MGLHQPVGRGFDSRRKGLFSSVAQLAEHEPFKLGVVGSSPARGTSFRLSGSIIGYAAPC